MTLLVIGSLQFYGLYEKRQNGYNLGIDVTAAFIWALSPTSHHFASCILFS